MSYNNNSGGRRHNNKGTKIKILLKPKGEEAVERTGRTDSRTAAEVRTRK